MTKYSIKIFILIFIISLSEINSQQVDADEKNIYSPDNILKFADHLFCENDLLRAIKEYERFLSLKNSDTVKFKLALANSKMKRYDESEKYLVKLFDNSQFSEKAKFEFLKNKFINNQFDELQNQYNQLQFEKLKSSSKKLFLISLLKENDSDLPEENSFINSFDSGVKALVKDFYNRSKNPGYKSKIKAILLSAILPGAGKIYTKDYGDGITAFILTGIFAFISYDNFKADHKFRGWLWGSVATLFYAGNIYGSAASANIYNAKIDISFDRDLNLFITRKNYFAPDYEFCK